MNIYNGQKYQKSFESKSPTSVYLICLVLPKLSKGTGLMRLQVNGKERSHNELKMLSHSGPRPRSQYFVEIK
ncbi:hypothetical protein BpHYR1_000352 [Brachionus plicatilis]|uniref:Uncharacterized protein n=1 Tax=Brachionus plicatilis TaxID=10195 RepID=A0A3M7SC50_BRAPC|nr:hypothetical protein BpHYR1_000352 [Brachionus plicatilis]